jgi:hypothetical protein
MNIITRLQLLLKLITIVEKNLMEMADMRTQDYYHHTSYKFEYEVRDGDVVKGEYTLDEADGTKRIVSYTSDKHNSFNAVVKKIGHAHHPEVYHEHGHHY